MSRTNRYASFIVDNIEIYGLTLRCASFLIYSIFTSTTLSSLLTEVSKKNAFSINNASILFLNLLAHPLTPLEYNLRGWLNLKLQLQVLNLWLKGRLTTYTDQHFLSMGLALQLN